MEEPGLVHQCGSSFIEEAAKHQCERYERFVGCAASLAPVEQWSSQRRAYISMDRDDYEKSPLANLKFKKLRLPLKLEH